MALPEPDTNIDVDHADAANTTVPQVDHQDAHATAASDTNRERDNPQNDDAHPDPEEALAVVPLGEVMPRRSARSNKGQKPDYLGDYKL